jgi:RND family efflux transporter MFP subunit
LWTLVFIAGCGSAPPAAPGGGFPPMPVEVETVKAVPVAQSTDYVATLKSRHSVQVQPQVDGHVTKILVSPGDRAKPGQPLILIDPARQAAVVNSARAAAAANRANLEFARSQFQRTQKLFERGAASRQDLEQAQSAYRQAQATAEATEAQFHAGAVELHYYTVAAPEAGTVGDIPVRVGDYVTPQTLLTTVDDNEHLDVYVQVPADRAKELTPGTPIELVDAAGKTLATSDASFVSPRVDPATQTVLVTAALDNSAGLWRSGQLVHARVVWSRTVQPTVPVLAVQSRAGQSFVWVARQAQGGRGWTVAFRPIQVGPIVGQDYPVQSGLSAGDRVVVSGVQKLRPGAPIMPLAPGGQRTGNGGHSGG